MPKLYDHTNQELFHLSELWQQAVNFDEEVLQAMRVIVEYDAINIDRWAKFYSKVKEMFTTFGEQNPHASDASANIIAQRLRILDESESVLASMKDADNISSYLVSQFYNFLAKGYEYANETQKSEEYKQLMADTLGQESLDDLIVKIDNVQHDILATRAERSKPRDTLDGQKQEQYQAFQDLLPNILLKLNVFKAQAGDNLTNLSLAYAKLSRAYRKVDMLDNSIDCARTAYELESSSNVRLNNLAIVLQKKATTDSLSESQSLLQAQLDNDILQNEKRFVTPYYLIYVLCQLAHHNILANNFDNAFLSLSQAAFAIQSAEKAITTYTDSNYAVKAQLRLAVIKSYQNLLITAVNQAIPMSTLQPVTNDLVEITNLDTSKLPEKPVRAIQAKLAFFAQLEEKPLPEQVIDFANSSFYL